jgi:hypothetical protein
VIALPYERGKVLRWTAAGMALAVLVWYAQRYRPAAAALALREQAVAVREERVRTARSASVLLGPAGLDSLLARSEADSLLLATRIPPLSQAAALSAEVKEALGAAERRSGARITATEPLPGSVEGGFQADGYAVRVVGRYAELRDLLLQLTTLQRLTRVRGLRLYAIPDSLVRSARSYGTPGGGPSALPADSAGLATSLADAGETPHKALLMFSLLWYTLPPAERVARGDSAAPASTFARGGAR